MLRKETERATKKVSLENQFSVPCSAYTVILKELKAVIKARTLADQINVPKTTGQQTKKEDDFQEVRRRKRRATHETTGTSKKATVQTKKSSALNMPPKEVVTRNFWPPQGSGHG
jgi:hypothetical protein